MKKLMSDYIRELRQNCTKAENNLWYYLRARRLKGYKFRRQHLVYPNENLSPPLPDPLLPQKTWAERGLLSRIVTNF